MGSSQSEGPVRDATRTFGYDLLVFGHGLPEPTHVFTAAACWELWAATRHRIRPGVAPLDSTRGRPRARKRDVNGDPGDCCGRLLKVYQVSVIELQYP